MFTSQDYKDCNIKTMVDPITNFGKATVSTTYGNLDTVIVLNDENGSRFPDPSVEGAFNLVWWNSTDFADPSDDPYREIVRVTNRIDDNLTIIRAQEATGIIPNIQGYAHNIPGKTYKMILALTKKMVQDLSSVSNRLAFTAQVINAPTTGTFLPNIPIPNGFALVVRATIGNTGLIYIANSVANATYSSIPGNRVTLNAGDVAKLFISNANLVAVAASAAGNSLDIIVEQ